MRKNLKLIFLVMCSLFFCIRANAYTLEQFQDDYVDFDSFLKAVTPIIPYGYYPKIEGETEIQKTEQGMIIVDIPSFFLVPIDEVYTDKPSQKIRFGQMRVRIEETDNHDLLAVKVMIPGLVRLYSSNEVLKGSVKFKDTTLKAKWHIQNKIIESLQFAGDGIEFIDDCGQSIFGSDKFLITENWRKSVGQNYTNALVYDFKKIWFKACGLMPSMEASQLKIITTGEGLGKDHFHKLVDNFLYYTLMKPLGFSKWDQKKFLKYYDAFSLMQDKLHNMGIQINAYDVVFRDQLLDYHFGVAGLEQNIEIQNLDRDQFGMHAGIRLDQPEVYKPKIEKDILAESVILDITGENLPTQDFWEYCRKYILHGQSRQDDAVRRNAKNEFYQAMKQKGSKFRLGRGVYRNDKVEILSQGELQFDEKAFNDATARINFSFQGMDFFIQGLGKTQFYNPKLGLFSTLLTLKFMREMGIPQEGVINPTVRKYDFLLDKRGYVKFNNFEFSANPKIKVNNPLPFLKQNEEGP